MLINNNNTQLLDRGDFNNQNVLSIHIIYTNLHKLESFVLNASDLSQ